MSTTSSNRFGEGWSMQDKGLTFYYLAFFFLRGLCRRLFMGTVKGNLFIGKNVAIRYPKNLHVWN